MLKVVIIDQEDSAVQALKLMIEKHIEEATAVECSTRYEEGLSIIDARKPDIIFADISTAGPNGPDMFTRLIHKDSSLVFTAAYEQIQAVPDITRGSSAYLVKPVDADELKHVVHNIMMARALKQAALESDLLKLRRIEFTGRIKLPIKEGVVYQPVSDIIWIESDGNYCTFHTIDAKKYVVSKNIGEYEGLLPVKEFFRVHRCHLINVKKVKKYIRTDGHFVEMENGSVLEIARRKKDDFLQVMNELN